MVGVAEPVDGFGWAVAGEPTTLAHLVGQPELPAPQVLRQHLDAFDQLLMELAGEHGDVLGGGRGPSGDAERDQLSRLAATLERHVADHAAALAVARIPADVVAGQVCGTAALLAYRARLALGTQPPAPLDGELDDPSAGVVSGFSELSEPPADRPWAGCRWVVRTEDGRTLPATLEMLVSYSSGVDREATLDAHRAALVRQTGEVADAQPTDRPAAVGALDHLLVDWLMAHRDDPSSVAIEIHAGRLDDAAMIVAAAAAAARRRHGS